MDTKIAFKYLTLTPSMKSCFRVISQVNGGQEVKAQKLYKKPNLSVKY